MKTITYENGLLYLPEHEQDVIDLIQQARQQEKEIRVRGSGHSVSASIYADGFGGGQDNPDNIDMMLSYMDAVRFEDATMQVTVQAGCRLGYDPFDPSGVSTKENSLFYQLDQKGWAVPDMGGITHQAVGGFMSTGSSGGSLQHSYSESIVRIRIIDGTGQVQTFTKSDDPDDPFYAVGVSLGLLGVITEVTFQCIPRFDILGEQITSHYDACKIDLFGSGRHDKPSLARYLTDTEYARLMWWPQKHVDKMVVWEAKRLASDDYNKQTNPPHGPAEDPFKPKPYEEFPPILGTEIPAELVASFYFYLVGNWPTWFQENYGKPGGLLTVVEEFMARIAKEWGEQKDYISRLEQMREELIRKLQEGLYTDTARTILHQALQQAPKWAAITESGLETELIRWLDPAATSTVSQEHHNIFSRLIPQKDKEAFWQWIIETLYEPVIQPLVLGIFVADGKQSFWDSWYRGLPMDNKVSDVGMPTEFTEIWFDVSHAEAAMNKLKAHYATNGYSATRSYACEIYAAKASQFWLSPADRRDVVRFDFFWYSYNQGDPAADYYPQFWELLKDFDFRLHWGKYMSTPDSDTGVAYLQSQYPKWDDFMQLRAEMDPDQIFVNSYWHQHLGM